ncbi:hypothetical protein [Chitinilyticum litopenaei]|uniref:hypothetical protein n=1 Tax=Chitinilyticum litopenaei TaxID=1121276 RepID=UPI00040E1FBB|nr:hypothetical protein [Chitinilyticum litopenaei]
MHVESLRTTTSSERNAVATAVRPGGASASAFASALASARDVSTFRSGRLGISLHENGQPNLVEYYAPDGSLLTRSNFSAPDILRTTRQYGIALDDLTGLGAQLDAAGVGYRPYELLPGAGSDHGIDFADLQRGGLGTAYDWRIDPLVDQKGRYARQRLAEDRQLASELGLHATVGVTRGAAVAVPATAGLATANSAGGTVTPQPAGASLAAGTADAQQDELLQAGATAPLPQDAALPSASAAFGPEEQAATTPAQRALAHFADGLWLAAGQRVRERADQHASTGNALQSALAQALLERQRV